MGATITNNKEIHDKIFAAVKSFGGNPVNKKQLLIKNNLFI